MTRSRALLLTGVAALGLAAALLLLARPLLGIQTISFHHVIATLEVAGLSSQEEARAVQTRWQAQPGIRQVALARRSLTSNLYIARVQFQADSPSQGAQFLKTWLRAVPPDLHLRPLRATHYACRILRPQRGDIVLGPITPISLSPEPVSNQQPNLR